MLKKICGLYLFAVAVLVAVHTVVEPLYHASGPGQPYSPFWTIVNPLTALAIVLGAVFSYARKAGAGGEVVTREFLVANTLFYGFLFVGIMFFWNWFNLMSPAFTAIGDDTVSLVWIVVDAGVPLLAGATGVHLLRSDAEGG
ncbi:MAG: hypothetical protein OXG29_11280 [Gammaproteobacteria bacterium]|nr:hypothetical protein [Gammaproteobacteria bacterium]